MRWDERWDKKVVKIMLVDFDLVMNNLNFESERMWFYLKYSWVFSCLIWKYLDFKRVKNSFVDRVWSKNCVILFDLM